MSSTETAETFTAANRLKQAFGWTETPDVPLPIRLAINATVWLEHVQALREEEEELLLNGKYKEAVAEQRVILSQLIADGERLAFIANKAGITILPSGLA